MKKFYSGSPFWIIVLVFLAFSAIGGFHKGWLSITGIFLACGVANFFGSRFTVHSKFVESLPARLLVTAAILCVVAVFVLCLVAGVKSRYFFTLTSNIGVGLLVTIALAASFIRGMTTSD